MGMMLEEEDEERRRLNSTTPSRPTSPRRRMGRMDPMMYKHLTMSDPQPDNRTAGHSLPFQHMQHQDEHQQLLLQLQQEKMHDHPHHLSLSVASPMDGMEVLDSSRKVMKGGDVEEDNDNTGEQYRDRLDNDPRRASMATIFPPMPFVPPRGGR